jgi:hypothetical protein
LAFEEARECAPTDLVLGSSEEVETDSVMDMITKQASSRLQEHAETGEEVYLCQREPSPVIPEVFRVSHCLLLKGMSRVAHQHERSEPANESKPLSSTEESSLSVVQSAESKQSASSTLLNSRHSFP